MLGQWLDWSLDEKQPASNQGVFASGNYCLHAPGILELTPTHPRPDAHACIFQPRYTAMKRHRWNWWVSG